MTTIKLCKDCKWCVPNSHYKDRPNGFYDSARCAKKLNPVDGSPKGYCEIERTNYGWWRTTCGPRAKYWGAK